MAAGVHDRHLVAGGVCSAHGAGVGQAGGLRDRQRVHVGAHQHHRSSAVSHDADDAGAADAVTHVKARPAQPVGDQVRGAMFLMRQFRMLVDVAVEIFLPGSDFGQSVEDRGVRARPGAHLSPHRWT
jgi:hypothetical protein